MHESSLGSLANLYLLVLYPPRLVLHACLAPFHLILYYVTFRLASRPTRRALRDRRGIGPSATRSPPRGPWRHSATRSPTACHSHESLGLRGRCAGSGHRGREMRLLERLRRGDFRTRCAASARLVRLRLEGGLGLRDLYVLEESHIRTCHWPRDWHARPFRTNVLSNVLYQRVGHTGIRGYGLLCTAPWYQRW